MSELRHVRRASVLAFIVGACFAFGAGWSLTLAAFRRTAATLWTACRVATPRSSAECRLVASGRGAGITLTPVLRLRDFDVTPGLRSPRQIIGRPRRSDPRQFAGRSGRM